MPTWLGYDTEAAAVNDEAIVTARMGVTGSITTRWGEPRADLGGRWWIVTPDDTTGLSGVAGIPTWPSEKGDGT